MLISAEEKRQLILNRIEELNSKVSPLIDTLNLQKDVDPNNIKLLQRTQKMIDDTLAKIAALKKELAITQINDIIVKEEK